MSEKELFGSTFPPLPPPPPPPMPRGWRCDNCHRINSIMRYQCIHCRGLDSFDLCEHCIGQTSTIHPGHTFALTTEIFPVPH